MNVVATVTHSSTDRFTDFALFVDAAEEFRARRNERHDQKESGTSPASFTYLVTGLSAGLYTFEIRWRTESGNTVEQKAATWDADRAFSVIELSN